MTWTCPEMWKAGRNILTKWYKMSNYSLDCSLFKVFPHTDILTWQSPDLWLPIKSHYSFVNLLTPSEIIDSADTHVLSGNAVTLTCQFSDLIASKVNSNDLKWTSESGGNWSFEKQKSYLPRSPLQPENWPFSLSQKQRTVGDLASHRPIQLTIIFWS